MSTRKRNVVASTALAVLAAVAVLALAGVSFAGNGHGKGNGHSNSDGKGNGHGKGHENGHGHGKGHGKGHENGHGHGKGDDEHGGQSASSAQYQYGSAGHQYGLHRVSLCHKGHTIRVAQPAVKAHLRHGDKLGTC